ncbi:MAG TPA: NAD(P)-dependent oxidoreductase [Solirubrobacteraceae bacterium]|nr:NAD(P)-dependent oxidoreductase [Solirubrobacteraceae bacterium]
MKVLITGASGLVGTECVEVLPRSGIELISLGRTPVGDLPHIHWDLRDSLPAAALPSAVDGVVHLAMSRAIRDSPVAAEEVFGVDCAAGVALAAAAARRGASICVYASSGAAESSAVTDAAAPLRFYASVKRATELLLGNLVPTVSLRLYFPFSPRRPCMVRTIAERVAAGLPVRLRGDDGVRLNPIPARDVAEAVGRALAHSPATIDVAGSEVVTLRDLATRIGTRLGIEPVFVADPDAGREAPIGDYAQTAALLERDPQPLDAALDELVAGLRGADRR